MYSLKNDFYNELLEGKYLAVLPISRFFIVHKFSLGRFTFYPSGEVNLEELKIVPNTILDETTVFKGQNLRGVQTSITGCNDDVFAANTLVVFSVDMDLNKFLRNDHQSDLKLIHQLSQTVEHAMDIIRFHFCRLDLPDFLPGAVGTWNQSTGFSGALIYNAFNNESYIIAGKVLTHLVLLA